MSHHGFLALYLFDLGINLDIEMWEAKDEK